MITDKICSCGATFRKVSDTQYRCPNCNNGMIIIQTEKPRLIKLSPKIDEDGIYVPISEYVYSNEPQDYRCIMTKEMFVEAYKKYILEDNNEK